MLMAEWCVFCVGLGLVFLVLGCLKSNLHGPSLCLHRSTMACCYFWVPLKSCVVDLSGFSHLPPILDARIPFHLLLLLSGDIEVHPGPSATFPCSVCHQKVADSERALCCDACDQWVHVTCDPGIEEFIYDDMVAHPSALKRYVDACSQSSFAVDASIDVITPSALKCICMYVRSICAKKPDLFAHMAV